MSIRQESNMSSKASLINHRLAFTMSAAGIVILSAVLASQSSLGQTAGGTTSIQRGSEAEKKLNLAEPTYQTREERLNAKPLDWNSTIGQPKPRTPTAAEKKAAKNAKRGKSGGGAPNPNAEQEARKLHPDDWK
jgi:hypothetical protein